MFYTQRTDGSPLRCRFCHGLVWKHRATGRVHEVGGGDYHVDHCPKRKAFYTRSAVRASETRRQRVNRSRLRRKSEDAEWASKLADGFAMVSEVDDD